MEAMEALLGFFAGHKLIFSFITVNGNDYRVTEGFYLGGTLKA